MLLPLLSTTWLAITDPITWHNGTNIYLYRDEERESDNRCDDTRLLLTVSSASEVTWKYTIFPNWLKVTEPRIHLNVCYQLN